MSQHRNQLRKQLGKLSKRKLLELNYGLLIEVLGQIGELTQKITKLTDQFIMFAERADEN